MKYSAPHGRRQMSSTTAMTIGTTKTPKTPPPRSFMKKAKTSPTGPLALEDVLGPLLVELERQPVGAGHDHEAEQCGHEDGPDARHERGAPPEPRRAGLALERAQVVRGGRGLVVSGGLGLGVGRLRGRRLLVALRHPSTLAADRRGRMQRRAPRGGIPIRLRNPDRDGFQRRGGIPPRPPADAAASARCQSLSGGTVFGRTSAQSAAIASTAASTMTNAIGTALPTPMRPMSGEMRPASPKFSAPSSDAAVPASAPWCARASTCTAGNENPHARM